ncbi:MAG: sulfotransferase [Hyphomonadaceae bacterium]|nr:sulfotransferase [Hyphomonadaceae bacterium]
MSLQSALAVLKQDPARAAELCRAILSAEPGNGDAQLVLSEALRLQGDFQGALALAESQAAARPESFGAHRQGGVLLAQMGRLDAASAAFGRAAALMPQHPTIWRDLGDVLARAGSTTDAQAAYARHGDLPPGEPSLMEAARAFGANNPTKAESILQEHLTRFPNDVSALRMLSEAQARMDQPALAEETLRRCLEIAPAFRLARHSLGQLLNGLGRYDEAFEHVQILLAQDPDNKGTQRLLASTHNNRGEYAEAIAIYEKHLAEAPRQPGTWASLGHLLKTVGRTDEAIEAYRKSLQLAPGLGLSYWSLANLKTFRFSAADVAEMERQLSVRGAAEQDRINLHFALGKALEDIGEPERAFVQYEAGAAMQRTLTPYDARTATEAVDNAIATFSQSFFSARESSGFEAPDPIFVVGLPRSGSTLVEQILASHSSVEGTMELPDLASIVRDLGGEVGGRSYLEAIKGMDGAALSALGERYLRTTRVHRKLGRRFFIDKRPNNWSFVGLIQLILPNAKIIDARRNPLSCCVSCFRQHFALGQAFTYDLADLGHYYRDYVRMMAHYDTVLPGRVHRVIHEDLTADPEPHIRALLDHCGLPFEDACLRPHETKRPVMTASSEQVRQPIRAKTDGEWRKFESKLGPLINALGPSLEAWRE